MQARSRQVLLQQLDDDTRAAALLALLEAEDNRRQDINSNLPAVHGDTPQKHANLSNTRDDLTQTSKVGEGGLPTPGNVNASLNASSTSGAGHCSLLIPEDRP